MYTLYTVQVHRIYIMLLICTSKTKDREKRKLDEGNSSGTDFRLALNSREKKNMEALDIHTYILYYFYS